MKLDNFMIYNLLVLTSCPSRENKEHTASHATYGVVVRFIDVVENGH